MVNPTGLAFPSLPPLPSTLVHAAPTQRCCVLKKRFEETGAAAGRVHCAESSWQVRGGGGGRFECRRRERGSGRQRMAGPLGGGGLNKL